jgi:hypothetical protein
MASSRSKTMAERYQSHPCVMPECGRPSHMYCSDGEYYCCVACQMGGVNVVGVAHTDHCNAYVAKVAQEAQEAQEAQPYPPHRRR